MIHGSLYVEHSWGSVLLSVLGKAGGVCCSLCWAKLGECAALCVGQSWGSVLHFVLGKAERGVLLPVEHSWGSMEEQNSWGDETLRLRLISLVT